MAIDIIYQQINVLFIAVSIFLHLGNLDFVRIERLVPRKKRKSIISNQCKFPFIVALNCLWDFTLIIYYQTLRHSTCRAFASYNQVREVTGANMSVLIGSVMQRCQVIKVLSWEFSLVAVRKFIRWKLCDLSWDQTHNFHDTMQARQQDK